MSKNKFPQQRGAIFVSPGSIMHDFTIINSTSIGGPMLVAEGATITGLTMSFNKVYGAENAIRLGDVFGAKIEGLFHDTRLPTGLVKEIVEAGSADDTKAGFRARLKSMIAEPAQLAASYELAEKIWQAGKPLIGL
ncbi:hypothetical protein LPW26_03200 [Rhodopseudomonas sp. HC1]|uniref:hypothetical protein n=1 Tax=Rhodopseudomonas infernalis TaxID=2897386 RepID=UPI001EE8D2D7|nr:hypothetical protein [Rhodopseudomonas infernalis]MCG6203634.1 hypothetical protein [Rhodopseudomonas infernalis]